MSDVPISPGVAALVMRAEAEARVDTVRQIVEDMKRNGLDYGYVLALAHEKGWLT